MLEELGVVFKVWFISLYAHWFIRQTRDNGRCVESVSRRRENQTVSKQLNSKWQKQKLFICSTHFSLDSSCPPSHCSQIVPASNITPHKEKLRVVVSSMLASTGGEEATARAGLTLSLQLNQMPTSKITRRTVPPPEELVQLTSAALSYTRDTLDSRDQSAHQTVFLLLSVQKHPIWESAPLVRVCTQI